MELVSNEEGTYEGEVDEDNKACGTGIFRSPRDTIRGTFYNDLPEGFVYRVSLLRLTWYGEMKAGKLFGKST